MKEKIDPQYFRHTISVLIALLIKDYQGTGQLLEPFKRCSALTFKGSMLAPSYGLDLAPLWPKSEPAQPVPNFFTEYSPN